MPSCCRGEEPRDDGRGARVRGLHIRERGRPLPNDRWGVLSKMKEYIWVSNIIKQLFLAVLNMESLVYNDENEETIFIVSRDNSATTFNLNISHREVNHIVYKSNFYSNMNDESI